MNSISKKKKKKKERAGKKAAGSSNGGARGSPKKRNGGAPKRGTTTRSGNTYPAPMVKKKKRVAVARTEESAAVAGAAAANKVNVAMGMSAVLEDAMAADPPKPPPRKNNSPAKTKRSGGGKPPTEERKKPPTTSQPQLNEVLMASSRAAAVARQNRTIPEPVARRPVALFQDELAPPIEVGNIVNPGDWGGALDLYKEFATEFSANKTLTDKDRGYKSRMEELKVFIGMIIMYMVTASPKPNASGPLIASYSVKHPHNYEKIISFLMDAQRIYKYFAVGEITRRMAGEFLTEYNYSRAYNNFTQKTKLGYWDASDPTPRSGLWIGYCPLLDKMLFPWPLPSEKATKIWQERLSEKAESMEAQGHSGTSGPI